MPKKKRRKTNTASEVSIINNFQLLDNLPDELNIKILSYLEPLNLVSISQVSTKFYKLSNDERLWKSHKDTLLTQDTPKTLFFKMKKGLHNIAFRIITLLRDPESVGGVGEDELIEEFTLNDGTSINQENAAHQYYYEEFNKIILNYKPVVVLNKILELFENGVGGDFNFEPKITSTGCIDQTFLHFFATTLDIDAIQLLIENKLDINAQDDFGITPVQLIFEFGPPNIDMLNFLIEQHADFNLEFDTEESNEEESDQEESKPEQNIICNICLKNSFNKDYLNALAFLVKKEVFTNNTQIIEYINSSLNPVRKEVFNKYLENFASHISNIIK